MAFHHHKQIAALEAPSSEKAVLNAMALFADHTGKCWPSQTTLAEAAGVSPRTVRNAITSLIKKNLVRVTHTQTSNIYVITLPSGKSCHSKRKQVPFQVATGAYEYTNEQINEQTNESFATQNNKNIKSKTIQGMIPLQIIDNISVKPKNPDGFIPADIECLWKTAIPIIYPDIGLIKPFTQAHYGMVKNFIMTIAPFDPIAVVSTVLHNWVKYVHYVKSAVGDCGMPVMPAIPFLAKYCAEAVQFHLELSAPAKTVSQPVTLMSKPVAPKAYDIDAIIASKEGPITFEELLAMEEEDLYNS